MEVPEGTLMLKSAKGVRHSDMFNLLLGIWAIYINLMGLPYWAELVRWIALRSVLPNS